MRRARRAGGVLVLMSMSAANACYAYLPVADSAQPVVEQPGTQTLTAQGTLERKEPARRTPIANGDQLRIALTPEGTRALAEYLGPGVRLAEGAVAAIDSAGTIAVAVQFVQLASGVRMPWTGEGVVGIPAAMRESVSLHTFQRGKTIAAGVALTAALVMTAVLALKQGGAGGDGSGGPPPPPP